MGECDGDDKPLAEGDDKDEYNEYDEDDDIANDDDKYAIGVDGVNEPLDEGDNEYDTLSAAPMQACPESHRPSVPSR